MGGAAFQLYPAFQPLPVIQGRAFLQSQYMGTDLRSKISIYGEMYKQKLMWTAAFLNWTRRNPREYDSSISEVREKKGGFML